MHLAATTAEPAHAPHFACVARRAHVPVRIDGRLDDAVWAEGPAEPLAAMVGADGRRGALREAGSVRFAWDARNFYVGARLTDHHVVTRGDANGLFHHRLGDVCEVFLKPASRAWYCEVHVTPNGFQTTFVWRQPPSASDLSRGLVRDSGVHVAAAIDAGRGEWTAEIAIPLSLLATSGERFAPDRRWSILVGRYNYGPGLAQLELSSFPPLPQPDFHRTDHYAPLAITGPHPLPDPNSNQPRTRLTH